MAIQEGGAAAWPWGLQAIDGVPYQLIITLPHFKWVSLGQLELIFAGILVFVAWFGRKKLGAVRGSIVGLCMAALFVTPLAMSIKFGSQRYELPPELEPIKLKLPTLTAFPSDKAESLNGQP